jgi:hypothetical protein
MPDNKHYICFSNEAIGLNPYMLNLLSKYNKKGQYEFKIYKNIIKKNIIRNSNAYPVHETDNEIAMTKLVKNYHENKNDTHSHYYYSTGKPVDDISKTLHELDSSSYTINLLAVSYDESISNALCSNILGEKYQIFRHSITNVQSIKEPDIMMIWLLQHILNDMNQYDELRKLEFNQDEETKLDDQIEKEEE